MLALMKPSSCHVMLASAMSVALQKEWLPGMVSIRRGHGPTRDPGGAPIKLSGVLSPSISAKRTIQGRGSLLRGRTTPSPDSMALAVLLLTHYLLVGGREVD